MTCLLVVFCKKQASTEDISVRARRVGALLDIGAAATFRGTAAIESLVFF